MGDNQNVRPKNPNPKAKGVSKIMTTTTFTFAISSDIVLNEFDGQYIANLISAMIPSENSISVAIETKAPRITKGQMIFDAIVREANRDSNEMVMTRQEIADEVGCVVGRIAEIIRDNSENDDVKNYVIRTKNDRKIRSSMKTLEKLQMSIQNLTVIPSNDDLTEILSQSIDNIKIDS